MLLDILKESKSESKIISLWNYQESSDFWCGYVKDFTDEFIIFQHITQYGKLDGVIIERISQLECIDFDSDYTRCMQYIVEHNRELELQAEIEPEISLDDNWVFDVLEPYIANENIIVRLTILNSNSYSGIVRWIDENEVLLSIVGNMEEVKEKTILKLEDVSRIRINDINSRKKLMLFKWRKAGMN